MLYSILFAYNSVIQEFRQGPAGQFFPSIWCLGSLSSIQLLTGLSGRCTEISGHFLPHCPPLGISCFSPRGLPELTGWEGAEVLSVGCVKTGGLLGPSQLTVGVLSSWFSFFSSALPSSGISPSSGDYHQGWGRRCPVTGRPIPGEVDRASVPFTEKCAWLAGRGHIEVNWLENEEIGDEWIPFTQSWL